jgi:hypothetical protein
VAGTFECGNEASGSIKYGEFLDWLRTCQLLKDFVVWSNICAIKRCNIEHQFSSPYHNIVVRNL